MKKKIVLGLLTGLCTTFVFGQHSMLFTNDSKLFNSGKELFIQHKYAASYRSFEDFLTNAGPTEAGLVEEAQYYMAANAYMLKQKDASDQLTTFLQHHPYSPHEDNVNLMLGNLAFDKKKYEKALRYYKKVDGKHLDNSQQAEMLFNKGYCLLQSNNLQAALEAYQQLRTLNSGYTNSAVYYCAYTQYSLGNYKEALPDFLSLESQPEYQKIVPYYIIQIYYVEKKYEELETKADNLLASNPNNKNNAEIYRIAGEIAYRKQNYSKAIAQLTTYEKMIPQVLRNDMYLLGLSYYETNDFRQAIRYLSKVTTGNDEMSENAYLHLGNAYIKTKDITNARLAYEAALHTSFNKTVREEAMYNYALTTMESTSAFGESVKAFEQFLQEFPESKYTDDAYDCLTSAYMTTKNYEAAYESIQKIRKPGPKLLETKQYLQYQIGTEAFMQNNLARAIEFFSQSLAGSKTGKYSAESQYWRAESYYRSNKTDKCINDLMAFFNNPASDRSENNVIAMYSMGYCYFSKKNYPEAQDWFEKYCNNEDNKTSNTYCDALNRIGDCYFGNRNFSKAEFYYNKAAGISPSSADYALFQAGYVAGLQKNYAQKIDKLEALLKKFPQSEYTDDALYETGRAYLLMNNDNKAVGTYQRLIETQPSTDLARKAAYEIGMIRYNNKEYEKAIDAFKNVIAKYPGTEEAHTALESLENVYVEINDVSAYLAYTKTLGINISNKAAAREDSILYLAAERQYINNNYSQAVSGLKSYVTRFGNEGRYTGTAQYYLADSYYHLNDKVNALEAYKKLLSGSNQYTEEAALRCAEIAYDQKDFEPALQYFRQLQGIAQNQTNKNAARLGILRCSYFLNDHATTISIVNEIMSDTKASSELKNEARYNRAKALLNQKQYNQAISDLKILSSDTRTANGAEAKYLLANAYFEQNKLNETESEVMDFAKKNTAHQFWLARSFVLLADVYIKRKDDFQAKQYLLSLQKNYSNPDEIQTMISERLNAIGEREKQTVIN